MVEPETLLDFAAPDFALVEDLTDAASDLSAPAIPTLGAPESAEDDALGLSVLSDFPLPGIFDLSERIDRVDSLVSDLPNEGYESKPSPDARSKDVAEALFDPVAELAPPLFDGV
jgi:hypothetical protein